MYDDLDFNYEETWPVREVRVSDQLWDEAQKLAHRHGESAEAVMQQSLVTYIQKNAGNRTRD